MNLQKSLCVSAIALLAIFAIQPPMAHAVPAGYKIVRQRGTISKIHIFDPKNPNLGPRNEVNWVEVDPEEPVQKGPVGSVQNTKGKFRVWFPEPNKITASSRTRDIATIKFSELRVGQKIIFSGGGFGDSVRATTHKVYLP